MRVSLGLGRGTWVPRRASLVSLLDLLLLACRDCRCISRGISYGLGPCNNLLAPRLLLPTCPCSLTANVSVCIRTYKEQDFWPLAQSAPGLGKPEASLASCLPAAAAAGTHIRTT